MIAEWSHLALTLALPLVGLQMLLAFLPAAPLGLSPALRARTVRVIAVVGAGLVALSFLGLIASFVSGDFSVKTAYEHSHSAKPLVYKISGTWGNHEGSILLWVLILSLFGGFLALTRVAKNSGSDGYPDTETGTSNDGGNRRVNSGIDGVRREEVAAGRRQIITYALGVQALVTLAFLGFTLFTSNPFERILPAPLEGRGLNPLLQDIGLALHPPLLYLGYVGFSLTFALTVAALIRGEADRNWARLVRPWALLAWTGLTGGIALGSWWAYYELGWGGFWFWDPVENLSFMPWLTGTAFIHSLMVVEKTGALRVWTLFLGVVTFVLAILGTFVVRSGLLTSVHAFAVDPSRGVFIIAILGVTVIGAFGLFAWRAPQFSPGGGFAPVSREGALVLNNLFLSTGAAVVLLGTFFPLIAEAFGQPLSVGKPYFDATFLPFMVPLIAFMAVGPFLPWQQWREGRGMAKAFNRRLLVFAVTAVALTALVTGLLTWQTQPRLSLPVVLGLGLAGWLVAGGAARLIQSLRGGRPPALSAWAVSLAHTGLGIAVFGMIAGSAMVQERTLNLQIGESAQVGHLTFRLDGVREQPAEPAAGRNFIAAFADVSLLTADGGVQATLAPERRFYPVRGDSTTEAAIRTTWLGDVFLAFNTQAPDGGFVLTLSWRPLIPWLWLGATLMVLGGLAGIGASIRQQRRSSRP